MDLKKIGITTVTAATLFTTFGGGVSASSVQAAKETPIENTSTNNLNLENENSIQFSESHNIQKRENDDRSPNQAMEKPYLSKGGAKCAAGIIGAGLGAVGGGVLGGISGAIGAVLGCS